MFRKISRLLQVCPSSQVIEILCSIAARYLAVALSFSLFLKIGPIPTPGPPGFNAGTGRGSADSLFLGEL
jgi:hypothetical protein